MKVGDRIVNYKMFSMGSWISDLKVSGTVIKEYPTYWLIRCDKGYLTSISKFGETNPYDVVEV